MREITSQYPEVISSIAEDDLHMTIQKINPQAGNGSRVDSGTLKAAAVAIQRELDALEPFTIEIGPARASGSAGIWAAAQSRYPPAGRPRARTRGHAPQHRAARP
ncbi:MULTISPECIES: hypothetical protein [unclassified Kitasatospora]|uniref:hypothetical protein n=1 Tax=unclassified Kitasatospora TaxID=2633591 RepID=UPI0033FF50F2